jgi:hypothetical protein
MSLCLVPSAIFCKLENEESGGATNLRQILFQIGKNFNGGFSDVATGLLRGLFEPYAMSRVVPAFEIGQNILVFVPTQGICREVKWLLIDCD